MSSVHENRHPYQTLTCCRGRPLVYQSISRYTLCVTHLCDEIFQHQPSEWEKMVLPPKEGGRRGIWEAQGEVMGTSHWHTKVFHLIGSRQPPLHQGRQCRC